MKWDIDEDPKNGPTGSTGLSEYREVFLGYNHESVALSTAQSWHLLGESNIGRELRALMSLLNAQTETRNMSQAAAAEETKVNPFQRSDYVHPRDPSDIDVITTLVKENVKKKLLLQT